MQDRRKNGNWTLLPITTANGKIMVICEMSHHHQTSHHRTIVEPSVEEAIVEAAIDAAATIVERAKFEAAIEAAIVEMSNRRKEQSSNQHSSNKT